MNNDVSVSDLCVTSFLKDSLQQHATEPRDDFTFFPDIVGGFSSNGQVEKIDVGEDIDDFLSDQILEQTHHDSSHLYTDVIVDREAVHHINSNSTCINMAAGDSGANISHIWDWDSDMNSQNFDDESLLEILGDQSQEPNANISHIWDWDSDMNSQNFDDESLL